MLKALLARLSQKHRTLPFPSGSPVLPERFRGRLNIDATNCDSDCVACEAACPTEAISFTLDAHAPRLDLGRCLFCAECQKACPNNAIQFTNDFRLAACTREELITNGRQLKLVKTFNDKMRRLFGRSLKLRQVSAGGCNGCEADVNVLNTIVFDLSRFGVQFVAAPRHADGLLITGPITQNMELALKKTYDAVPPPKLVIAVGACAISGGPYFGHAETHNGVDTLVPVDLYIPGCPPHPLTILDGLLRLVDSPSASRQP